MRRLKHHYSSCTSRRLDVHVNAWLPRRSTVRRHAPVAAAAALAATVSLDAPASSSRPLVLLPPPPARVLEPSPPQPAPRQPQQALQAEAAQASVGNPVGDASPQGAGASEPVRSTPAARAVRTDLRRVWQPPRLTHAALTVQISQASGCGELLALVQANAGQLNAINICAGLTRTAHLFRKSSPPLPPFDIRLGSSQLIPLLVGELRGRVEQLSPRGVASAAHALAALDVRDRELFADLGAAAERCMHQLTTQGLSNVMWAFARTAAPPSPRWMQLFVGAATARLPDFSAQDLAMILWALSRLKYRLSPEHHQKFAAAAAAVMPAAGPQALSMLAYALATSGQHPGTAWLDALASAAVGRGGAGLSRFTPQGLSVVLWALSYLGYVPSAAFSRALAGQLRSGRLASFGGLDVATTLFALSRTGITLPPPAFGALMWRAHACLHSMDPTQLSNTALAVAHLTATPASTSGHPPAAHTPGAQLSLSPSRPPRGAARHPRPNTRFLLKLVSASYTRLPLFNSLDLAMLIQGLAHLRLRLPDAFLSALAARVEAVAGEFSPQNIALSLWGLQRLGVPPSPHLLAEFFLATDRRLSAFKPSELAVMIWALAQAQHRPEKAWIEEFLHCTFPRLPDFDPHSLACTVAGLAGLRLRPPPAWLYALVKSATPKLAACNAQDLAGLVAGLRALNDPPGGMQLPKVEEFLEAAQEALAALPADQQRGLRIRLMWPADGGLQLVAAADSDNNGLGGGGGGARDSAAHQGPAVSTPAASAAVEVEDRACRAHARAKQGRKARVNVRASVRRGGAAAVPASVENGTGCPGETSSTVIAVPSASAPATASAASALAVAVAAALPHATQQHRQLQAMKQVKAMRK